MPLSYAAFLLLGFSILGRSHRDPNLSLYDFPHDLEELHHNLTEGTAPRSRLLKASFRGNVPDASVGKKSLALSFHEQELGHLDPLLGQVQPGDLFQRQAADEATAAAERAVAACGPAAFADLDGVDIAEKALPELGAGSASRPVGKVLSGELGKDAACCLLCAADPGCDFWVRDAPIPTSHAAKSSHHYRVPAAGGDSVGSHHACRLKRGFKGYHSVEQPRSSVLPSATEVSAQLTCCVPPPKKSVYAKACPPERACKLKALPTVRGGFVGQASAGIALLRMPLAGGATLGPILEHYSNRLGLRLLQDPRCYGPSNPLGQSWCCARPFAPSKPAEIRAVESATGGESVGKDEELLEAEGYVPGTPLEEEETVNLEELSNVPPVPPEGPGPKDYQVLLAPSLYDAPVWSLFLPPSTMARKVVLLRHPIDVLEAAFHQTLVRRWRREQIALAHAERERGQVAHSRGVKGGKGKGNSARSSSGSNNGPDKHQGVGREFRSGSSSGNGHVRRELSEKTLPRRLQSQSHRRSHRGNEWGSTTNREWGSGSSNSRGSPAKATNANSAANSATVAASAAAPTVTTGGNISALPVITPVVELGTDFLEGDYCDNLGALTFNAWLSSCPMATQGEGSLLHFLDPPGLTRLVGFLGRTLGEDGSGSEKDEAGSADAPSKSDASPPPPSAHSPATSTFPSPISLPGQPLTRSEQDEATQWLERAAKRLESDFAIVGLFSHLDVTLLLVEKALKLRRTDVLYSRRSMAEPPLLHDHPAVSSAVHQDPEYPLPRDAQDARVFERGRAALAERLTIENRAPTSFLVTLYGAGEAVHERQARLHLGSAWETGLRVSDLVHQLDEFTACYEALRRLPPKGSTSSGSTSAQHYSGEHSRRQNTTSSVSANSHNGHLPSFGTCPRDDLTTASSARWVCTARARDQMHKTELSV